MSPPKTWILSDHACRFCGSRILRDADAQSLYRCASCGVTSQTGPENLCGCGLTLVTGSQAKPAALYRCAANPRKTPDNPADIVICCTAGER